jgi:hypothetical protein
MRLIVRGEQMDVMRGVSEANFERRVAAHLRQSYPASVVRLPDGGEFTISELLEETLDRLVRASIAKARAYEMRQESSISAFVALMFDVAPNFDEHRLCTVLLGDEEKPPDDRIDEILTVLTEKNYESIRKDYDPQAWKEAEELEAANASEAPAAEKANAATANPMMQTTPGKTVSGKTLSGKTLRGKTLSGKTLSNTVARRSQTIKVQPEIPDSDPEIYQNTVKVDRND